MRARRAIPLLVLVLLAASAVLAATAPAAQSRPWIDLADGRVGSYLWSVEAKRPSGHAGDGRQGTQRPCLSVATMRRQGALGYSRSKYRQCTDASGRLTSSEPLVVAAGMQPALGAPTQITAVGMIFARPAKRVRVTFGNGGTKTIALDSLTRVQARTAGLGRFRYAAFAVHGAWCAERLVSLGPGGEPLWDSGTDEYSCVNSR